MGNLFNAGADLPYCMRLGALKKNRIALWDVLESCYRPGSLDSAIDGSTAAINDFERLFETHRKITHVFFNGRKAAEFFEKRVLQQFGDIWPERAYVTLPSTSPAHASLSFAQKLDRWREVKTVIDQFPVIDKL
jgi:hypoxanthine-DNA glycosylase